MTSEDKFLVEFYVTPGVQQVARSEDELAQRSAAAIDNAMATIKRMGERLQQTLAEMDSKPESLEVNFGIKLTAEAGALISKVGGEAALNVKLVWSREP
jgi:hypothetical protein